MKSLKKHKAGGDMSKGEDDKRLRPIVLSAVKAIMKAHLEDLKNNGLLFHGPIIDIDISENLDTMTFRVSKELTRFLESHMQDGSLQNGLSSKIVIILDADKGDTDV